MFCFLTLKTSQLEIHLKLKWSQHPARLRRMSTRLYSFEINFYVTQLEIRKLSRTI